MLLVDDASFDVCQQLDATRKEQRIVVGIHRSVGQLRLVILDGPLEDPIELQCKVQTLLGDDEGEARLHSYDLAFKMQREAPEVFDLSRETAETLSLYGVGNEPTDDYGRRCLLARRLVEKGVRFICVVSGGGPGNLQWDAHKDIEENHLRKASETDKPVAGLLRDLKRRGLLDETLVLWGGEFGRSPEA